VTSGTFVQVQTRISHSNIQLLTVDFTGVALYSYLQYQYYIRAL